MRKGFTIIELLVAMGLLAAVIAAAGMIFHYSVESQRAAAATAEIMRTLRVITDQININFEGLRKDGYIVLWASNDSNDAIYFFSTGDFQSWYDPNRSNTARIYLGPSQRDANDLVLDMHLLTPGYSGPDYNDVNCPSDIVNYLEDPCNVLSDGRPTIDINNPDDIGRLLARNVRSFKIEWTDDSSPSGLINWYGMGNPKGAVNYENTTDQPYLACWTPANSNDWPRALKFTFTLYDSRKVLKSGRKFEYIVYIGK